MITDRQLRAAIRAEIERQADEAYQRNPGEALSGEAAEQVRRLLPPAAERETAA